jgi:nucleosome binding factor SPN SPT16 subunit
MPLPPQTYLFAYEFSDTLMLLTNTKVIFYSSIKKRMLRKLSLIRTTEMTAAVCLFSLERLVLIVWNMPCS